MKFVSQGPYNSVHFSAERSPQYYDAKNLHIVVSCFEEEENKQPNLNRDKCFTYLARSINDMQEELLSSDLRDVLDHKHGKSIPHPYSIEHEAYRNRDIYLAKTVLSIVTRIIIHDPLLMVHLKLIYG